MGFYLPNYTDPNTGAAITYFVITNIAMDFENDDFIVTVNGFVSQANYAAGMNSLTTQQYTISGSTYTQFLSAPTAADLPVGSTQQAVLGELISSLYQNMLTFPFFAGAAIQ